MSKRKAVDGSGLLGVGAWRSLLDALKRMEQQLTRSVCNDLLEKSTLLPCDHIVCSACISHSMGETCVCPSCNLAFLYEEIKPVKHMDRIVSLFNKIEAATNWHQKSVNYAHHDHPRPSFKEKQPDVCVFDNELHKGSNLWRSPDRHPKVPSNVTLNEANSQCTDGADEYKLNPDRHPKAQSNVIENESNSQHTDGANESKKLNSHSKMQSALKPRYVFDDKCAFCHSFRSTEASGPLMCYIDGKLVPKCKTNTRSDVISVHQKCIIWATRVYSEGETFRNLEVELQRSSKLTCSKCGMNGAALDCYFDSCRKSFHVPCAVAIPECRWDCDNLCMLCPSHISEQLPCDVIASQKKIEDEDSSSVEIIEFPGALKSEGQSKFEEVSHKKPQRTFLVSDILAMDKELLCDFVAWTCDDISLRWTENVTHVIAATNENGACKRTHEFIMAILTGKWILKTEWIEACLDAGELVPEEPYEVFLDECGFKDGPKRGRLRVTEKAQKLFTGMTFCFSDHFTQSYKQCLEELAIVAGGTVLTLENCSSSLQSNSGKPELYFVYNDDPPKEPNSKVKVKIERCEEAKRIVLKTGAQYVGHISFLDAIVDSNVQCLNL